MLIDHRRSEELSVGLIPIVRKLIDGCPIVLLQNDRIRNTSFWE